MIRFEDRFDEYAYRVASLPLDASVTEVNEGQFVTIKKGKVVLADKTDVCAFIAIGSKRAGRNQVAGKIIEKISFLHGNFMLSTDQFDKAGAYSADMTALTVANGTLTPAGEGELVVAHAIGTPVNGFLRIVK